MKTEETKTKRESLLLGILLSVLLMLFILSASLMAVIGCRPFYYAHLSRLALDERAGITAEEARAAYDEMLDYCLGKTDTFGTGVLHWSEAGKSHFDDCRVLFLLDFRIMAVTGILLLAYLIFRRWLPVKAARVKGRGPGFWGGTVLLVVFVVVAGLAALDFDRAFVIFHALLFPGKSNWIFDWNEDAIIRILPEVFFRNCGIAVVVLLVAGCVISILLDRRYRKRHG